MEKNRLIIDQFSITKFHELYIEIINSKKNDMNYSTEVELIKKNLIITIDNEQECINLLRNLINKDKNKKMDDIALEYRNMDEMMNDEDMEVDEEG